MPGASSAGFARRPAQPLAIQLTPDFEMTRRSTLELLYEKEDLLVEHGGKDNSYNYYRLAGVEVTGPKGSREGENPPVDPKTNMP